MGFERDRAPIRALAVTCRLPMAMLATLTAAPLTALPLKTRQQGLERVFGQIVNTQGKIRALPVARKGRSRNLAPEPIEKRQGEKQHDHNRS